MDAQKLAMFLIGLAVAATLLTPIASTVSANTGQQSVTNETVSADVGNYVQLDGYDLDDGETVYWYNSTSGSYEQITEGTDYEINQSAGSILAKSGGTVGDGDTLKVNYTYQATAGTTTTVLTLLPLFVGLVLVGGIALKLQEMM